MKTNNRILLIALVLVTLCVCSSSAFGQLKLSGILGQSQPSGTDPCPFIGASGAALDRLGKLWTVSGDTLYGFDIKSESPKLIDRIKLPTVINLGVQWDGQYLYAACWDSRIHIIDLSSKTVTPVSSYSDKAKAYAVAPAGLASGFAKTAKFFLLENGSVNAYTSDGKPQGTVLTPAAPNGPWHYCAIGVEPNTGNLLLGSYYPDTTVYRYKTDGKQVTTDGWPRRGVPVDALVNIGKTAWALSNHAVSLPNIVKSPSDIKALPPAFSFYNNGLAQDAQGNYWMSATQGVIEYDSDAQPLHKRIGGISGVHNMAVLANGTLLGSIENGQRMFRMPISDEPDAALSSNANEPWRTGGNWSSVETGIAADGAAFILLDETLKQLWRYDPERTDGPVWTKLTEPDAFKSPRSLAVSESFIWTLDENALIEIKQTGPIALKKIDLPGINSPFSIASSGMNHLYVTDGTSISSFTREKDGVYSAAWTSGRKFSVITSLCAAGEYVYALDKTARSVFVLSSKTGETLMEYKGEAAGSFEPTAITALPRWLFIADEAGKRIIRMKVI